jgi:hypothetical protein
MIIIYMLCQDCARWKWRVDIDGRTGAKGCLCRIVTVFVAGNVTGLASNFSGSFTESGTES